MNTDKGFSETSNEAVERERPNGKTPSATPSNETSPPCASLPTSAEDLSEVVIPKGKGSQCPCFVAFLRVLLNYLKRRGDKKSYFALRRRLQVCTEKSKRQEPGYECVAQAVLDEIPEVIKLSDLRRVQAILRARVQLKKKHQKTEASESVATGCTKFDNLLSEESRKSAATESL